MLYPIIGSVSWVGVTKTGTLVRHTECFLGAFKVTVTSIQLSNWMSVPLAAVSFGSGSSSSEISQSGISGRLCFHHCRDTMDTCDPVSQRAVLSWLLIRHLIRHIFPTSFGQFDDVDEGSCGLEGTLMSYRSLPVPLRDLSVVSWGSRCTTSSSEMLCTATPEAMLAVFTFALVLTLLASSFRSSFPLSVPSRPCTLFLQQSNCGF